jgi:hypothetical protein
MPQFRSNPRKNAQNVPLSRGQAQPTSAQLAAYEPSLHATSSRLAPPSHVSNLILLLRNDASRATCSPRPFEPSRHPGLSPHGVKSHGGSSTAGEDGRRRRSRLTFVKMLPSSVEKKAQGTVRAGGGTPSQTRISAIWPLHISGMGRLWVHSFAARASFKSGLRRDCERGSAIGEARGGLVAPKPGQGGSVLPGQWDRRQQLAEDFGCRQGVSEERCPQRPLPERTTPPTVKRTDKCVDYPAVRVVYGPNTWRMSNEARRAAPP